MGDICDLVNTHHIRQFLTGSSCAGYCHSLRITLSALISFVPAVNKAITPETEVDTAPDSGTGELRGRTDQGRTVSLVTGVPTVRVAVTLVVSGHTLPPTGARPLCRGADYGGTLSLVSPVLTVRDPVTPPGLGQTQGRAGVRCRAVELIRAASLVNILLVRIISTVIISIIYPSVCNTLSVITLKLSSLTWKYGKR